METENTFWLFSAFIKAVHGSGGSGLGSNRHSTHSSRVNRFLTRCRPNGRSKPFISVLRFGGSDSSGDQFEGKEHKERKNSSKEKAWNGEKERNNNSKNQISSLEWR